MDKSRSMRDRGQDAAAAYLERVGICVVERRWSCDVGKIDIVAYDGDTLVLVDVATRKASRQGEPWALTSAKARRLKRLVKAYSGYANLSESTTWRYDRIDLLVITEDRALLRHHRDALAVGE